MKYAMQHKIQRDMLICETASPIETLCYFAGYLVAHVPERQHDFEKAMWVMVEIPHRKRPRRFKPPQRLVGISANPVRDSLGMLVDPVSMGAVAGRP